MRYYKKDAIAKLRDTKNKKVVKMFYPLNAYMRLVDGLTYTINANKKIMDKLNELFKEVEPDTETHSTYVKIHNSSLYFNSIKEAHIYSINGIIDNLIIITDLNIISYFIQ